MVVAKRLVFHILEMPSLLQPVFSARTGSEWAGIDGIARENTTVIILLVNAKIARDLAIVFTWVPFNANTVQPPVLQLWHRMHPFYTYV